jgi:solute carrier family 50 protein (sugar transporter)
MTGNTIGWITYSILTVNYFIFFANLPGFLLSVWFNLCAVKLQHQTYCATEMRQSFVGFLESNNSQAGKRNQRTKFEKAALETMGNQESAEEEKVEVDEENDTKPWQLATDLGGLVLQVTTQQTPAPAPHEKVVIGIIIIWTVIVSMIALVDFDARTRELIVGIAVNINLFFFYGAPLSTIVTVLKERNSASIHLWTMTTNTMNGAFWTAYGIAVLDAFIYVPNGIGALLGVVQIVLIVLFPRKHHTEELQNDNQHDSVNHIMMATREMNTDRIDEGKEQAHDKASQYTSSDGGNTASSPAPESTTTQGI